MTNPLEHHVFHHVIRFDTFVSSMTKLMRRISYFGSDYLFRHLLPTLVEVRVPPYVKQSDLPIIRRFFRRLRESQNRHFIRVVSDLIWVMESDSSDVFYSKESKYHKDITFELKTLSTHAVEVKVIIPFNSRKHITLRNLSREMLTPIEADPDIDSDASYQMMAGFHFEHQLTEKIKSIDEDLHVIFIPDRKRSKFYPIPLWGLSVRDAYRKYNASKKNFRFLTQAHPDIMGEEPVIPEIFLSLVKSIQDNEESGNRTDRAPITYGLAELLFGYYLVRYENEEDDSPVSANEMILFDYTNDADAEMIDVVIMRMKDVSY